MVPSSAYRPSSDSDIWCAARAARKVSGPRCSATSLLTAASASTPSELTQSASRASSGRCSRVDHFELAEQTLGGLVEAVGRHGGVDVGADDVDAPGVVVDGSDHCVGCFAIGLVSRLVVRIDECRARRTTLSAGSSRHRSVRGRRRTIATRRTHAHRPRSSGGASRSCRSLMCSRHVVLVMSAT